MTSGIAGLALSALFATAAPAAEKPLRIIPIDVEGGAATLYVTPQGKSLLIDTGWPSGMGGSRAAPGTPPPPPSPSSAERIVAAAKAAGVTRLDYLMLSHYHTDHIGGAVELAGLMPIGAFVDHGSNREEPRPDATPQQRAGSAAARYAAYVAMIGSRRRIVMKPGDTLRLDALTFTAVNSDRAIPTRPLPGGGKPGADCASATTNDNIGGEENPRSLGVVASWGRARILSLGDTTWDVENSLVCPIDLVGPVDLMFADNHGTGNSNSPQLVNTVRPSVMVFANGPTKGADASSLAIAKASPRIQGVWQLHTATRSPEANAPVDQIANVEGADAIHPFQIAVTRSGAVTLTNPRTGFTKTYPKARQQ